MERNSSGNEDEENLFYFEQERQQTGDKWRWILVNGSWKRILDLKLFKKICLWHTTWSTLSQHKFDSDILKAFLPHQGYLRYPTTLPLGTQVPYLPSVGTSGSSKNLPQVYYIANLILSYHKLDFVTQHICLIYVTIYFVTLHSRPYHTTSTSFVDISQVRHCHTISQALRWYFSLFKIS